MKKTYFLGVIAILFLFLAGPAAGLTDINTATQSQLEDLPGIGPVYAQKIIAGRPYSHINEIKRIRGIGGKTFAKFKDMITVGTGLRHEEKKEEVEIPVYSVEQYRTIKCPECDNDYKVSSELQSGWCPYCGCKWRVKK